MHPVLFKIGSVSIYSYGFFVAIAMVAVLWVAGRRAVQWNLPQYAVMDILFLLFVSGIIGARFFFVVQHWPDYESDPWKAFSLQEGGLVWYGGFVGAVLVGIFYSFLRKWPILKFCDFLAPLLALGHAIGRLGCFFNGCCYGAETKFLFAVVFPQDNISRHPTQLYESAFLFCLAFFLFRQPFGKRREGEIFVQYLLFYSAFRFLLEFLRGDQVLMFGLTLPQWISLVLFLGGLLFILAIKRRSKTV